MKKLLFILLTLGSFHMQAQIKVGKNAKTINPSSLFEMESDSLGMLLPRVSLTSTTSFTPLKSHVQGMVVYNLATAGAPPNNVTPGFYYNDGTKWVLIGNATGIAKVEDTALNNNNAFRYINVNGDTIIVSKVHQNILSYDSASKQLITNVNGVLDTVILNVQKFDTTHVYNKIKADSTQFAQKVDSVFVNTAGDSVFVKDGYGATVGYKLAQFDTTHAYNKIKADSTQFAQKVDSVFVNTAGDSVFVKDGYGAIVGYKLAQFDTTHVYNKIKADSTQFAQKVDSVFVNAAGDSVFVKDGYGATVGYKLAQFDTTHAYNKIKADSTQFAQKVDSVFVNAAGDSVFVKDGYGAMVGYKLAQFDTTHVYNKIKADSTQFAQKVDSVFVNAAGDSVFVKDGYGATIGYKLAQFDTTHVYNKIKADSTQFAQKVDSVFVNTAGDSVFVKDGYGATVGYKLAQFDTTHVYNKIKADSVLFKNKVDSVYLNTAGDTLFVIDQQYGTISSYKLATPIARNGLSKSGDTVVLGGNLTQNTTLTNAGKSLTFATNGDTIKFTGLLNGKATDSLLVLDSASSTLKKIAASQITTLPIRVVTGSTTITLTDHTVVLNSTSAATFTLPAASTAKDKIFRIANHAYFSGQDITLSLPVKYGTGTSTSVDDMYVGGSFFTSSTVSSITIQSDGTDWWFIGR